MSQEKISHVRALGAEVRITRSDVTRGHPEYYQDVAFRLAEEIPGGFYVNQFGNPANPLAHERTTGPEIWEQMRHDVDAVVVGVGSGGTLTGLGRFFNRVKPRRGIEMVLADPTGSVLYEYVKTGKLVESGSWAVKALAKISFLTSLRCRSSPKPMKSMTKKVSRSRANSCAKRESLEARRPEPWWLARCVTAVSNRRQSAW